MSFQVKCDMRIMYFLANNRKLAISITLNALLAIAASTLLYLVYPEFVYDLDSVSNLADQYSVRTYRRDEGHVAYFEVLLGHRRLYSYSGKGRFLVETFGSDMTGKGVCNIVIRQWDGSARGYSQYRVLELEGGAVTEIDVVEGVLDAQFKDLNDDGILEISGVDESYSYFLGDDNASSPRPPVVLSFDKTRGRFILNKSLMLKDPLSQGRLKELSLEYKNNARWHEESRPPSELFRTMLGLIYNGNEGQAWELFDMSWPDGSPVSKEEYRKRIESELDGGSWKRSPFYPVVVSWSRGKRWTRGTATVF